MEIDRRTMYYQIDYLRVFKIGKEMGVFKRNRKTPIEGNGFIKGRSLLRDIVKFKLSNNFNISSRNFIIYCDIKYYSTSKIDDNNLFQGFSHIRKTGKGFIIDTRINSGSNYLLYSFYNACKEFIVFFERYDNQSKTNNIEVSNKNKVLTSRERNQINFDNIVKRRLRMEG